MLFIRLKSYILIYMQVMQAPRLVKSGDWSTPSVVVDDALLRLNLSKVVRHSRKEREKKFAD